MVVNAHCNAILDWCAVQWDLNQLFIGGIAAGCFGSWG